jgi:hypothetical protein
MRKMTFLLACCLMAVTAWATNPLETDCGDNVQITASPTTGYHFVKWQKGGADFEGNDVNPLTITSVDASATYRAFFAINVYNYKFVNYDGTTELKVGTINHGETPTSPDATPTKPSTAQYDYSFSGWLPNIGAVTEDNTVFVAQFNEILRSYVIHFVNWDGTPLQSSSWDFGTTPIYGGETPTREEAGKTYTFLGWDEDIVAVNGEKTYTAVFSGVTNTYAITPHAGEGGTVSGGGEAIQYGQSVTITATPNDCYEFVRWSDGNTEASRTFNVTGALDVTAEFTKIKYTITVESDDTAQGTVDAVKL